MRRWWPLFILSAVAFTFFWQYFLLDQTIYAGDTAFVFFPFHQFATQNLMAGKIPLWNPYLFGGTPGFAESTYQILYWPNLLFWLTGVVRGIGWTLPLHLLWLSAGVYLFARRMKLGRLESLVAAIAFTYGGSVQGRLGIPVYTQAASWIPWISIGYDIARQRGGAAMVLPGLALAMQLLTGGLPYTYYSLVLLGAYHLLHLKKDSQSEGDESEDSESASASAHHKKRAWCAMGATLGLGILLTIVQLLPQAELALSSDRVTRASYEYATYGSLVPQHLITMVLPKFYGLYSTVAQDGFIPSTEIGYVGVLPIGLAIAAYFSSRRRMVRFWTLVMLLGLFLALGKYNPLYPFLYRWVPGVGTFRTPGCWLLISSFALSILAAIGMETLRQEGQLHMMAARAASAVLLTLSLASALLLLSPFGAVGREVATNIFGSWPQVLFIALCAVPPLLLALPRTSGVLDLRRRALMAMPLLVALDLFLVAQDMEIQQTLSVAAVQSPAESTKALQRSSTTQSVERFWPDAVPVPMEKWLTKDDSSISPLEHRARSAAIVRALMPSCLPAEFQTMGLTGAWGSLMPLRRHARPIYKADVSKEEQMRWLRLLNVRTYLSVRPLDDPRLTLQSSESIYLYRDDSALPQGFFVPQARSVLGEDAIAILSQPSFDPKREVLIENGVANDGVTNPAANKSNAAFDANAVRVTDYLPERVRMDVTAPQAGHVVLMDTIYPGWRASIDGQETPIQIANWMGRSVPVAAGNHRVEMWFEPASVRLGAFISLLAVAFTVAYVTSTLSSARRKG